MIDPLINEAKMILQTVPYDAAHNFHHHERVWSNTQQIIKKEKLLIDEEALCIAVWWHDVDKGSVGSPRFMRAAHQYHIPQLKIDAILAIMNQHSFDDEQTTMEGKLLFDADKLEYVSLVRWKQFLPVLQKNPLMQDRLKAYQVAIGERIIPVYRRLYFEISKQRFAKDFLQFSKWYFSYFHIRLKPMPPA